MKKIREICLVEDERIQLFLLNKFIEKSGVAEKVTEYRNGKQAYDALKLRFEQGERLPDIIFLDINMPVWDGWEFFESFQSIPGSKNVTTYILTSSLSKDDFQTAKNYGLSDRYLQKPISMEKLVSVLSEW